MSVSSLTPAPAFGTVSVFDASGVLLSSHSSIQDAVTAANAGETVLVGPGFFVENVVIGESIHLASSAGREATFLVGVSGAGAPGTILVTDGANGVTIGEPGHGLTIVGIDNGAPGVENAAIYLQGSQDTLTVQDNEIIANGDHGLLSEFNGALTNAVIDGNVFSGQSFVGPNPAGVGFGGQFTTPNVPRQLVVIGEGGSGPYNSANITFTNNVVSGRTGGISTDDGVSEQGNTMVTIDVDGATISGNVFTGETARLATALRARGPDTDVENNSFDNSFGGDTRGVDIEDQGTPGEYAGNTFTGGDEADLFQGTPGDDAMTGGAEDDTFFGGGGNDAIDGGGETDTAIYAGARADYTVTAVTGVDGRVTGFTAVADDDGADGDEGTDALTSIERLIFSSNTQTPADDVVLDLTLPVQVFDGLGALVGTFATIQEGVDAAPDGGSLNVAAGTYREQIVVEGRTDLTITGAGPGTIIESPDSPLFTHLASTDGGSRDRAAVVTVRDSDGVVIENAAVDGRGRGDFMPSGTEADFEGVLFFDSAGSIEDLAVTGVRDALNNDGTPKGNQRGNAVVVINDDGTAREVSVTGVEVEDFQKNGVTVAGAGLTANVTGNTVTGAGFLPASNAIAQNGIQMSGGAGGVIDGNTVQAIGYQRDDFITSHILVFDPPAGVEVTGNTLIGTDEASFSGGLVIGGAVDAVVTGNSIEKLFYGASFFESGAGVDGLTFENNDFIDPVAPFTPLEGGSTPAVPSPDGEVSGGNLLYFGDANVSPVELTGTGGVDIFVGSDFADDLSGLAGDDDFTGGEGDDSLDGGAAFDTANYAGNLADYTVTAVTDSNGAVIGFASVTDDNDSDGDEGTDTLTSIERLVFADAELTVDDSVLLFDGGGNLVASFETIQAAVDAASDGFTIRVGAGTYAEAVVVDADVTILGANEGVAGDGVRGAESVIDGGVRFAAGADGATLDGVRVEDGALALGATAGVYVQADGVTVTNSVIVRDAGLGFGVARGVLTATNTATGLVVSGNAIEGWATGVYLNPGSEATVTGNVLSGNNVGLSNDGPDANDDVSGNTFDGNVVEQIGVGAAGNPADVGAAIGANTFTGAAPEVSIFPLGAGPAQAVTGTVNADVFNGDVASRLHSFTGGEGDDVMFAQATEGAGVLTDADSFVFSGARADYTVATGVDPVTGAAATVVTDTVGTDGTDYLVGVETAIFSDGAVRVFGAPDTASTTAGAALMVDAADLLANDIDIRGDELSITHVFDGVGGTASLSGTEITFTPDGGFTGEGSFFYEVEDGFGGADLVEVTVNVEDDAETNSILVRVGGTGTEAVPPQFRIVVDGVEFGPFAVTDPASSNGGVTFESVLVETTGAAPDTVQVVYFNDGTTGGINRNLFVDYIEVNGDRLESEVDGFFTRANGSPNGEGPRENLLWNGTLTFDDLSDVPPETTTVTARVGGTGTEAVPSQFSVTIDGVNFGTFAVTDPAPTNGGVVFDDFEFVVNAASVEDVSIEFVNDGVTGGVNRNLFVDYIDIDETRFEAEVDGNYVRANGIVVGPTENMFWAGTMFFDDLLATA